MLAPSPHAALQRWLPLAGVALTGAWAAIASVMLATLVVPDLGWPQVLPICAVYALTIIMVDTAIITMPPRPTLVTVRLLMALCSTFVVGMTVVTVIFRPHLQAQLSLAFDYDSLVTPGGRTVAEDKQRAFKLRTAEEKLRADVARHRTGTQEHFVRMQEALMKARDEQDGVRSESRSLQGTTGVSGCGPRCRSFQMAAEYHDRLYKQGIVLAAETIAEADRHNHQINALELGINQAIEQASLGGTANASVLQAMLKRMLSDPLDFGLLPWLVLLQLFLLDATVVMIRLMTIRRP